MNGGGERGWKWSAWTLLMLTLSCLSAGQPAHAHSASDAYLTLAVEGGGTTGRVVVHGQWDVALRDLDFVLKLDDDGDGRLTWGEVRRHRASIERLAYAHLRLEGGTACTITPDRLLIDGHADGAYAALFFDAICTPAAAEIMLHYSLFFAIDPSHRAIVVSHSGASVATAVLSPQNSRIALSPMQR